MSVTVVIKEGGLGKSLTVDKLKTNVSGGGTQLWIPEKKMGTKTITQNGTYEAKDDDAPGWDKVIVNVAGGESGSVTGHDPDTGEDVNVSVDPETGDIVETVVPSSIRITTPPTKTVYNDGETIDYSGIVVHAYSATGQDMGAVPFNKLVFPVTTAQGGDEWSDGQGLNATEITYMPVAAIDNYGQEVTAYVSKILGERDGYPSAYGTYGFIGKFIMTRYNGSNYALWKSGDKHTDLFTKSPTGQHGNVWHLTGGTSQITKIDRFESIAFEQYLTDLPNSTVNPTTVDPTTLNAAQSIPVQWARTGDGRVLEDTFSITVN